jgi:hypothetical protein
VPFPFPSAGPLPLVMKSNPRWVTVVIDDRFPCTPDDVARYEKDPKSYMGGASPCRTPAARAAKVPPWTRPCAAAAPWPLSHPLFPLRPRETRRPHGP